MYIIVLKMGAEQAKLLDAGEKLTGQLQEISKRMAEISQQNQALLTEKKEEIRQLKAMTVKQPVPKVQIGSISEFDCKSKWSYWYERFELFCAVNNINQDKRVPLFLIMIGNEGYSLLRNLCASGDLKNKSITELSKIMKDHLEPESNVVTDRYNFKERKQSGQEGIKDYVANLKSLATKCNFENLDNCLRDQFVWGLKNKIIKQKLLNEVNLTFKRAVEIATLMEDEAKNISHINGNKDTASGGDIAKDSTTQTKNKIVCYCCGKANHTRNNCPFKNDKCNKCGMIGHLQQVCSKKRLIKDNQTSNKNTDKSTSIGSSSTPNTCTREHVTDDPYHLSDMSPMYDRDNVNNGFSRLTSNSGEYSLFRPFGNVDNCLIRSTPSTPKSISPKKCCYCQFPIPNAEEIHRLGCQHSAHKKCYENLNHIMKCKACPATDPTAQTNQIYYH